MYQTAHCGPDASSPPSSCGSPGCTAIRATARQPAYGPPSSDFSRSRTRSRSWSDIFFRPPPSCRTGAASSGSDPASFAIPLDRRRWPAQKRRWRGHQGRTAPTTVVGCQSNRFQDSPRCWDQTGWLAANVSILLRPGFNHCELW
jgi:hypothetical protein